MTVSALLYPPSLYEIEEAAVDPEGYGDKIRCDEFRDEDYEPDFDYDDRGDWGSESHDFA
jgi:hypothetical protein